MSRQLEIKKLYKADGEDERVVIKVLADCDLGDYIITDATFGIKGGSSNLFRHVFEFPTYLVEKGDWVVLYTKKVSNIKVMQLIFSIGTQGIMFGMMNMIQ